MFKGIIIDIDSISLHLSQEDLSYLPFDKKFLMDLYEKNVTIGFTTKSSYTQCEEFLRQLDILPYIHYFQGREYNATLENFHHICFKLNVSPGECVLLTDNTESCTLCKNSPFTVVAYMNPKMKGQNLSSAYMLIEGFDEVNYDFINTVYLRSHGKPVTIAMTKRCIIRELTLEDIPVLYDFYQEPKHTTYLNTKLGSLEEELEKHKAYQKHSYEFYGFGLWGVFLKDSNQLIGHCGIECKMVEASSEIELGYLIHKNYQKQGYATESCRAIIDYCNLWLEIPRIIAVIDQNNIASIHVAKSLGMTLEKQILRDNKICELYKIEVTSKT